MSLLKISPNQADKVIGLLEKVLIRLKDGVEKEKLAKLLERIDEEKQKHPAIAELEKTRLVPSIVRKIRNELTKILIKQGKREKSEEFFRATLEAYRFYSFARAHIREMEISNENPEKINETKNAFNRFALKNKFPTLEEYENAIEFLYNKPLGEIMPAKSGAFIRITGHTIFIPERI